MSIRSLLATLLPAAVLVTAAARLHPAGAGFLGILVMILTVATALALLPIAGSAGPTRGTLPVLVVLFVAGAAATGIYWYRVWSFRSYEMEGIPLLMAYIFGFWWPGVFVAVASRVLETGLQPVLPREYLIRLGVGFLAGVAGTGLYKAADRAYYATRDRVPIEEAVRGVAPSGRGIAGDSFTWTHHEGRLTLTFRLDPSQDPTYRTLRWLDGYLPRVADLTRRKDTDTVALRVEAPGGTLLSFEAEDRDEGRPIKDLTRLERDLLPTRGILDQGSLDAIAWTTPSDFLAPAGYEAFRAGFRYSVADSEVTIAFAAAGPPAAGDVDVHAGAWKVANTIVNESVRFFPDVARFRVSLPGLTRVLEPSEVRAPGYRLQTLLMPTERVLGLVLRHRGEGEEALDPAAFYPNEPAERPQFAVVRVNGPLVSHLVGFLYEELLIETGRLWVTALAADGEATLLIAPWEGPVDGPVALRPGEERRVAGEAVRNVGWFEQSAFRTAR